MMRAIVPKIHEEVQLVLRGKKMRRSIEDHVKRTNVFLVLWRPSFKRSCSRRITIFPRDVNRWNLNVQLCQIVVRSWYRMRIWMQKRIRPWVFSHPRKRIVSWDFTSPQMSSDQCCLFWEVWQISTSRSESSQHILEEVVLNFWMWHNELVSWDFYPINVFSLKNEEGEEERRVAWSYNSGRDKMLASLFKAHELMESRIKPLRVPFGEIRWIVHRVLPRAWMGCFCARTRQRSCLIRIGLLYVVSHLFPLLSAHQESILSNKHRYSIRYETVRVIHHRAHSKPYRLFECGPASSCTMSWTRLWCWATIVLECVYNYIISSSLIFIITIQ